MRKIFNFFNRNLKEILRDPLSYIFCLGFPIVMLVLFHVINHYAQHQPVFSLPSLLPGILVFSYGFVMLFVALAVSKDRETFFLKRLYSSPMKSHDFILGYALVGLLIGLAQTVVCVLSGLVLALLTGAEFLSLGEILLLSASQLPILLTNVFLGILFGTIFNDKTAPGICSVFISAAGVLGGCWMPLETMGGFETLCRCLPFYPSVYLGRIFTNATNALGGVYAFNPVAAFGLIPIFLCLFGSIFATFFAFKRQMTER